MPILPSDIAAIDDAAKNWRQGDAFVDGGLDFVHVADLNRPLTAPSAEMADAGFPTDENLTVIDSEGIGYVIVSQTCDVVRSCEIRPMLQVAALTTVDEETLDQVRHGFLVSLVYIPALADRCLVADLDRLMTIEKSVLAAMPENSFVHGVTTDRDCRAFAESVARRFARFAFPDDFVEAVGPIQKRIKEKHSRQSPEGQCYRTVREIRVAAAPSWEDPSPNIEFLFIVDEIAMGREEFDDIVASLIARFKATGVFAEPSYRIISLENLSAAAYCASERLDLDYLSRAG